MNPAARVRAVLFDADGVLQYVPGNFADRLAAAHGLRGERADAFARALFAMEVGAAQGRTPFAQGLAALIAEWQLPVTLARMLDVWQHVAMYDGVREVVGALRARGIRCALATNQHDVRAGYLSDTLGYTQLFDVECYSCRLGARKPEPAFFTAAVAMVGCSAKETLLIDDTAANVEAACALGLQAVLHLPEQGAAGIVAALQAHGIGVH